MSDQPFSRQPHRYQPDDQFRPAQPENTSFPPTNPAQNTQPAAATQMPPSPASFEQPLAYQAQQSEAPLPPQPAVDPLANQLPIDDQINPNTIPDEVFLEWDAPSRPHKKRKRQYYFTIAIILILIAMILFFAGQFLPIAVLAAVGFLVYVLEMVPPTMVHHSISTFGFRVEGTLYFWNQLGRFWFDERYGHPLLHIETFKFPNRITVLIDGVSPADITDLLSEVLIHQQPPLTPLEKAAAWLERTLPLETDAPATSATPMGIQDAKTTQTSDSPTNLTQPPTTN